jgi:hypothetical protein
MVEVVAKVAVPYVNNDKINTANDAVYAIYQL